MVLPVFVVLAAASFAAFGQAINPVTINDFNVVRDSTTWMFN
jgi:hypothetical protein